MDVNRNTTAVRPCSGLEINTNMAGFLGLSKQRSTAAPCLLWTRKICPGTQDQWAQTETAAEWLILLIQCIQLCHLFSLHLLKTLNYLLIPFAWIPVSTLYKMPKWWFYCLIWRNIQYFENLFNNYFHWLNYLGGCNKTEKTSPIQQQLLISELEDTIVESPMTDRHHGVEPASRRRPSICFMMTWFKSTVILAAASSSTCSRWANSRSKETET